MQTSMLINTSVICIEENFSPYLDGLVELQKIVSAFCVTPVASIIGLDMKITLTLFLLISLYYMICTGIISLIFHTLMLV